AKMNDPDITMEEYIQLETKKALRRGQVYNWETATYVSPHHVKEVDLQFEVSFAKSDDDDYTI
ncbi:hypothetical protein Tco_1382949, partial [Tanacetum coccineum]